MVSKKLEEEIKSINQFMQQKNRNNKDNHSIVYKNSDHESSTNGCS